MGLELCFIIHDVQSMYSVYTYNSVYKFFEESSPPNNHMVAITFSYNQKSRRGVKLCLDKKEKKAHASVPQFYYIKWDIAGYTYTWSYVSW